MIRCERVVHVYPDGTRALDGVDLVIGRGERVAIVGSNGSGKTTLVRTWNGLVRATSGTVTIGDRPTDGRRVAELARIVGLSFQDPGSQLFARRCRDEAAFGARNVGLRGAALDGTVDAALAAVGLDAFASINPYDLGRPHRKLLAVACVLAMRTPVVVLDEPTAGQDRRGLDRLREVIANLAGERRTVVLISHDLGFVAETVDRVVVLDRGRVVRDGPVADVLVARPSALS